MSELDRLLIRRLRAVGVDPDDLDDPAEAWLRLRDRFGPRITLVDRYALEAAHRGVETEQLPPGVRDHLTAEVLPVEFPGIEFVPGSGRSVRDAIVVVPYHPGWPRRFEGWRRRLSAKLGPVARRIDHVGSTAVPGLAAKPIIDIQISVPDVDNEAAYVPAIEAAGVSLRMREPEHRYFRPGGHRPREVQVHVCESGSVWERDHLLFRDYLRAHRVARDAYARLKGELADRYRDDRIAYTDAKSAFILDALNDARLWAARAGVDR